MTPTPDTPPLQTGAEILASVLAAQQVRAVFTIPGYQLDWAMNAISRQAATQLFVPRHEQATTYMADGYARISGSPGVAMVVPGPGVLNACAGLATAYANNSRVFLIAAQIHSTAVGAGFGLLHEIPDQSTILSSLTKHAGKVSTVDQLASVVTRAYAHLIDGRPRPVAVEIPHDVLSSSATERIQIQSALEKPRPIVPSQDQVNQAAKLIDAAKFPIFYAGGGVLAANASGSLLELAEKLQAPVVMSDDGRGALSDRHPLAMNTLAGRKLFERADLVVVVGSRFMDITTPTTSWQSKTLRYIFINIDQADMSAPRSPALAMNADADATLAALRDSVTPRVVLSAQESAELKRKAQDQIDTLSPLAEYVRALRNGLPEDGVLVNELTQVGYLARIAYPVLAPRTYLGPGYQGTLGYGFPTALGAAVAAGGRRVLSITGDGGFGWNLQELSTARKYALPVTVVVFNDGVFSNVRDIQRKVFGSDVGADLCNPDFFALAKAFGVPGVRTNSPEALQSAIKESVNERGPVLIEAMVGSMPSPWPLLRLRPLQ